MTLHRKLSSIQSSCARVAIVLIALGAWTRSADAQVPFESLHTFPGRTEAGTTSNSIMQGVDGDFYLTAARGGTYGKGAILKMTPAGAVTSLHSFSGPDGTTPFGPLIQTADGDLYGTTESGGSADLGTIFRLSPGGSLVVLHSFAGGTADGANPRAGLAQSTGDGRFYGATYHGGTNDGGTVFGMTAAGVVTLFPGVPADRPSWLLHPNSALVPATDGAFYGTTPQGAFKLDGSGLLTEAVLDDLRSMGLSPRGPIVEGVGGAFYTPCQVTRSRPSDPTPQDFACLSRRGMFLDGPNGGGVIVATLHWADTVGGMPRPSGSVTALIQGSDQNLYGLTSRGGTFDHGKLFRIGAPPLMLSQAPPFTAENPDPLAPLTLYSFDSATPDALLQAADGSLYGTTSVDGTSELDSVFRMTADGIVNILYRPSAPVQGAEPSAFIQGRDGDFYGATKSGGRLGNGTLFRMTSAGTTTDLHVFSGEAADGAAPNLLVQATDGSFIGTTLSGGAYRRGTVFRIDATGTLSILHSFGDGDFSAVPSALIQATDGSFYGTTKEGGEGAGTVFRIGADGAATTLHSFIEASEGSRPESLIEGTDGSFYGTTVQGCSIRAFKMSRAGVVIHVYPIDPPEVPGGTCTTDPRGTILQAADGNLYGITIPYGRFFRLSQNGQLTILRGLNPGDAPLGALVKAADGNFFGTVIAAGHERVARITALGVMAVLYSSPGNFSEASTIQLLEGFDGNVYGIRTDKLLGAGVVYRLLPHPAPTAVRVRALESGVALSWAPAIGATGYRVWRRSASGAPILLASNVTATSFVDTAVTSGQRYYYIVTAMTAFGESVMSYEVAATPGPGAVADFDGDGRTDVAVYRGSSGFWYILESAAASGAFYHWGDSTAFPMPADYDGDRRADVAVFDRATGIWDVRQSSTGIDGIFQWGLVGDVPAPGDYDGDGRTDIAVFRPATGIWYVFSPANNATSFYRWGLPGDIPTPGDYDGDGKTDIAVWRPSTGIWYIRQSSDGAGAFLRWGLDGDVPVPGDYDGDGETDAAVFRPSTGTWYVRDLATNRPVTYQWGLAGDNPVTGDFDGDGKTDIAVFRPSTGIWYIRPSSNPAAPAFYQWGLPGDLPVLYRP